MANFRYAAADYAVARGLFKDGHKLQTISDRTGIPVPRLSRKAKEEGWTKRREDVLGLGAEKRPTVPAAPVVVVEDAGHTATDESRKLVHGMAGFGLGEEQIAIIVGISVEQLRAGYAHELATAPPKMLARVTQSLYQMATDTNRPNVIAAKYLHECWTGSESGEALGKKEVAQVKAKRAAAGKYAPAPPPKLVAAGGKIVK